MRRTLEGRVAGSLKGKFLNNYSLFGAVTGHSPEGMNSPQPDVAQFMTNYQKL